MTNFDLVRFSAVVSVGSYLRSEVAPYSPCNLLDLDLDGFHQYAATPLSFVIEQKVSVVEVQLQQIGYNS